MPTISRFFGIVIAMDDEDHAPPHFHARYGGQHAAFCVDPLGLIAGERSPRALGLVMEWARLHRAELLADRERAQRGDPALFKAARVDPELGVLAWPNGADLDSEVLRWGLRPAAWDGGPRGG